MLDWVGHQPLKNHLDRSTPDLIGHKFEFSFLNSSLIAAAAASATFSTTAGCSIRFDGLVPHGANWHLSREHAAILESAFDQGCHCHDASVLSFLEEATIANTVKKRSRLSGFYLSRRLRKRCTVIRPVRRILSRLAAVRCDRNCCREYREGRFCWQWTCSRASFPTRRLYGDRHDHGDSSLARRLRTVAMEGAGKRHIGSRARLISVAVVVLAVAIALYALRESEARPTSSDSSIDADIVHVAAAVGGRITQLPISENARVAEGALLFQIDPLPYRLAVEQADADLSIAEAQLETQQRLLATQRSTAAIAANQTKSAQLDHDLAARTLERLRPLAAAGYVPQQQFDQAQVLDNDTATKLIQAQEQEDAAYRAIDTEAAAEATVRARRAALAIAQRQLEDTTVRASHNGLVVGLTVSTGEMVIPAQSLFTLINTDEWFAVANFRETDLDAIAIGDCATVFSMINRREPIKGIVQGIGWGVADQDRINIPRSIPYVERSLNWVRVAQRFPVRVRLENPPQALMRLGASAVVEIKHGAACR